MFCVRVKFHDFVDLVDRTVKPNEVKNLLDVGFGLHGTDANRHFRENRLAYFACLHTHRVNDSDEHCCGDVFIGRSENCGSRKRVETDVLDKVAAFEGFFNQGGLGSAAHFRNVELDARERGCHGSDEYG